MNPITYKINNPCDPDVDGQEATCFPLTANVSTECSIPSHHRGLVKVMGKSGKLHEWTTCWEAAIKKLEGI